MGWNERHTPTGIVGFDQITGGGLPANRVTAVLGGPGSGKTLFAIQTLVHGARSRREPGLFVAFEESAEHLRNDVRAFSWGFDRLLGKGIAMIDARLSRSVVHGGDFDLIGLLAIIGAKAKRLKARRIVLDGLDVVLALLEPSLARREVFRLRDWLLESGMTAIITAKVDGEDRIVRDYDYLQFMADCVVTMQHRVVRGTALRFVRVVKQRGAAHSANEFPMSIGEAGIEVAATTSAQLRHRVSSERVSTGVARLDAMLTGGYYRGASTLITGAPGTAKTTLAAAFADAACRRNERSLIVSFDEAPEQIIRNVRSVRIDLAKHVRSGLLRICSLRSRAASPESHVAHVRSLLREHRAQNVVVDPLSALSQGSTDNVAQSAAIEILDHAKTNGITSVLTSLVGDRAPVTEQTPLGISTVADNWLHVSYVSQGGERNRALTIIKSRGTEHSNQVRELVLSREGVTLADVYTAGGEVLMGTLRWERENEERRAREAARRVADLRRREAELTIERLKAEEVTLSAETAEDATELRQRRHADAPTPTRRRSRRR
jgi:circadian clock protein KaiC